MPFFNFFNCENYDCNEVDGYALYMGFIAKRRMNDTLDIYDDVGPRRLIGTAFFDGVNVHATLDGVTYRGDYLNQILDAYMAN